MTFIFFLNLKFNSGKACAFMSELKLVSLGELRMKWGCPGTREPPLLSCFLYLKALTGIVLFSNP